MVYFLIITKYGCIEAFGSACVVIECCFMKVPSSFLKSRRSNRLEWEWVLLEILDLKPRLESLHAFNPRMNIQAYKFSNKIVPETFDLCNLRRL